MRMPEGLINEVLGSDTDPDGATPGKGLVITGSGDADYLYNDGGSAKFLGLGGDDTVDGSYAADTIIGGDGDDFLLGNGGDDAISGGLGDDYLRGHMGDDTLNGGAGYDTGSIYALGSSTPMHLDLSGFVAGETTVIDGGVTGTDTFISIERINITAGSGDDYIIGASGDSGVTDVGGANYIDTGAGDDFITTYGGGSTLIGGDGDDRFQVLGYNFSGGLLHFIGGDGVIDAGEGFDTAEIDWSFATGDVMVKWGKDTVRVSLSDGSASQTITGLEALTFQGGFNGGATIRGGDFNDSLGGGSGVNLINGRGGNDYIGGGSSNDVLVGGGGDDVIYASGGDDTLSGGQGLDRYLILGGGSDDGHSGYVFDLSAFDVFGASQTWNDYQGYTDTLSGFEGVEVYTNELSFHGDTVIGSAGSDIIHDSLGTDVLNGGAGDDLILQTRDILNNYDSLDVDDTLSGGSGLDTLSFENGFQTGEGWTFDLAAGTVTAFLTGTDTISGFEHVMGSGGADTMLGSSDGETLDGGAGADLIDGRGGADVLGGGLGGDVFVYEALSDSSGRGVDLITDLGGEDVIDLSAIDADETTSGDQAFHQVSGFTHHAGELVMSYDSARNVTHLTADVDGDGRADFAVNLSGDQHLFDSFVL